MEPGSSHGVELGIKSWNEAGGVTGAGDVRQVVQEALQGQRGGGRGVRGSKPSAPMVAAPMAEVMWS